MTRTRSGRLSRTVIGCYPLAWRRRYEREMLALLADAPPGARQLLDLLRAAALAHLRRPARLEAGVAPAERMTATVAGVCLSFGLFALAGAALAKATEDGSLALAAQQHPLLAVLRGSITVLALVAAGVVALGGAPLLLWVLRLARRERRADVLRRLALAPAALALFTAATVALVAWAQDHSATGAARPLATALFLAWLGVGLGCGLVCALAPRLVLARVHAPRALLNVAVRASVLLGACMVAIAGLSGAYAVALTQAAPALAAQSAGPWAASTTLTVAAVTGVMLASAAAAGVSAARGIRALRRSAASGPGAGR